MQEAELLKKLRQKRSRTLEAAMDQYGGYVAAVVRNVLGSAGSMEDTSGAGGFVHLSSPSAWGLGGFLLFALFSDGSECGIMTNTTHEKG